MARFHLTDQMRRCRLMHSRTGERTCLYKAIISCQFKVHIRLCTWLWFAQNSRNGIGNHPLSVTTSQIDLDDCFRRNPFDIVQLSTCFGFVIVPVWDIGDVCLFCPCSTPEESVHDANGGSVMKTLTLHNNCSTLCINGVAR